MITNGRIDDIVLDLDAGRLENGGMETHTDVLANGEIDTVMTGVMEDGVLSTSLIDIDELELDAGRWQDRN